MLTQPKKRALLASLACYLSTNKAGGHSYRGGFRGGNDFARHPARAEGPRSGEVKQFAQCHVINQCQSQDPNPGLGIPRPALPGTRTSRTSLGWPCMASPWGQGCRAPLRGAGQAEVPSLLHLLLLCLLHRLPSHRVPQRSQEPYSFRPSPPAGSDAG